MSESWLSRFFGIGRNRNETKSEKSLEDQRKDLEEQIRINRLKKAAKLTESYADTDYWLTAYVDLLARYKDGFALAYPITQPTDRRYGGNFPFWYSEQQLGLIRAQARMVTTMSPNAQGLLNGLTSYVIGSGYRYDVVAKPDRDVPDRIMVKVQDVIDDFCENNAWTELEQELFWRSREDGEFFLRMFPQENGKLMVRVIEPEQVFMPPGGSLFDYSYGIRTDVDDVCNVIGYAVSYIAPGGEGEKEPNPMATEEVPAERIVHVKVNTKRNIKRGLSDFSYDTLEAFQTAAKLRTNLGEGSAVQAAIAGVRQHDAASFSQVDSFVNSQTDYAQYSPVTQRATDFQQIKSGTFVDIPKGMNFVPPPGATANAISGHLEVFQALLRSAGNRHNAPEWLVSADASNNNYASSMTAESPFLRHCKRLQEFYKRPFLRVIKAAIENAIDAGKLPTNIMEFIDITATPPELEVQDKSAQAMANQVYAGLGIKSRQTIAHELGLDWDTELTNQQEYAEQMGQAGGLQMPGAGPMGPDGPDGGPDDGGPDQVPDGGPDQGEPGLREQITETVDEDDEEAMQVSGEAIGEAERYAHINFTPPKAARDAAARALAARKRKAPSERGMTATGIARARDLVAGKKLSPDTIRRMHSFFSRHEVDKKGESWDSQGKGWQAWNGWGGDAGFAFARKVIRQMDAADTKEAANPAISAKIAKLRAEGYPQKQAVAIALSMSRRGELGEGRWVTMGAQSKAAHNRKEGDEGEKHGGVAVYIDDDGTILKGPSHMTGKKPNEIKKQQRIGAEPVPAQGTIFGAHTEPPKSVKPEPAPEPEAPAEPFNPPAKRKKAKPQSAEDKQIMDDARSMGLDPQGVLDLAQEQYSKAQERHQALSKLRRDVRQHYATLNKGREMPSPRWAGWEKGDVTQLPHFDALLQAVAHRGSEFVDAGLFSETGELGNEDREGAAGSGKTNAEKLWDYIHPRRTEKAPSKADVYAKALDDAKEMPDMQAGDELPPEDPFGGFIPGEADEYAGRDWADEEGDVTPAQSAKPVGDPFEAPAKEPEAPKAVPTEQKPIDAETAKKESNRLKTIRDQAQAEHEKSKQEHENAKKQFYNMKQDANLAQPNHPEFINYTKTRAAMKAEGLPLGPDLRMTPDELFAKHGVSNAEEFNKKGNEAHQKMIDAEKQATKAENKATKTRREYERHQKSLSWDVRNQIASSQSEPIKTEPTPAQSAKEPEAPTKPQADPDPVSEPTTDLARAAEPKKSDTPRDVAKRVADENAKNYAFARESSVSNMGEDLLGSARHTRNLWRGLEQAEQDGTAAEMVSRENLMKVEPHRLLEKLTPKNALSSLAGHLALSVFPAEVGNYRGLEKPTPPAELRKQYFDAYREIKNKIESGVSEGLKPQEIMQNATQLASSIIEKLRKPSPENANLRPNQMGQYSDRFNPVANGLVDFVNKARDGIRFQPNKTSPMGRLHDFVKRVAEKYGDQVSVETLDHIAKHVGDIIEGHSFNKTFDTVKKGARKFDPSNAYDVANVIRTGGRKINAATTEDAARHLMDNAKLRGVQWGNYVTDDERKHHATKLSEALADLADSLGIPDSAVSLGGRLGMAIGARGKAGAMAHYEPKMQVINLTRSNGVGSLAHEWAHALDHSIEGFGKDLASQRLRDTPAGKAMSEFRKAIGASGYSDRLRDALHANKFLTNTEKKYWSSNEEVFARTMERFIQRRLQSAGRQNTYLVGLKKETHEFWPNDKEMEAMEKPITALIDAIRESHLK